MLTTLRVYVRIWVGVGFGVRVSEIKRSKSNYLVNIFVLCLMTTKILVVFDSVDSKPLRHVMSLQTIPCTFIVIMTLTYYYASCVEAELVPDLVHLVIIGPVLSDLTRLTWSSGPKYRIMTS